MEYAQHLASLGQTALMAGRKQEALEWLALALMAVPGRAGQRRGKAQRMATMLAVAIDQLKGIKAYG